MGRRKSAREKKKNRQDNSRPAIEERRKAERRAQELGGITSGKTLKQNIITPYELQNDLNDNTRRAVKDSSYIGTGAANNRVLADNANDGRTTNDRSLGGINLTLGAVGSEEVDGGLKGGDSGSYRLRKVYHVNGSSQDAARSDHWHSRGFKTNLTQDERKEFVAALHELEAIEKPSPVERMVALMARMTVDDPGGTAEELIDFLDNGDPLEVHEWRANNESEYIARENLLTDPAYRVEALHSPFIRRIAEEYGIDYTVPVTEKEERDQVLAQAARRRELEEFPEILREGKQHQKGRLK